MAKGRVLVIDEDEWVARLLAAGLRDHGFDVSSASSGGFGLEVARTIQPDCIVTEMTLSDLDGPSVAKAIRAEQEGQISRVPILFLTNADDTASRLAAFHAGCDVYLTKPFRVEEIAMQVQALVAMVGRLKGRDDSFASLTAEAAPDSQSPGAHAIEGNIAQMSIATVLTLLEMEHRTGELTITARGRKCTLEMIGGFASRGTIGGSKVSPLAVLRQILCWKEGRFRFRPGTDTPAPTDRRSIGALLIEAVRLDDEFAHEHPFSEEEEVPTARRQLVLGGSTPPPSRRASSGARRTSREPPAQPTRLQESPRRISRPPPAAPSPERAAPKPGQAPLGVRPQVPRPGNIPGGLPAKKN